MVRDPGNRFTENVSFITFVEKPGVPQSPMGQTNHETPKTIQATMEPSSDLRAFLATLCRQSLKHLEKSNVILQVTREAGRLTDYGISCSKLETFLTRQRPILQFQLSE